MRDSARQAEWRFFMHIFKTREFRHALAIFSVCLILSILYSFYFGSFSSGFPGGDEGAHFINSFFVWRFLGDLPFSDPLGYSREFYLSYPGFSIGLWPPLYYLFVGLVFFAVPATPESAMAINLAVTILPVLLICCLVLRFAWWPLALLAGLLYTLSPVAVNETFFFRPDFPLALVCFLAALTWQAYANAKSNTMLWGFAYGVIALAAIMVKGGGWLLGLYPAFHILFSGQWRLLRAAPTYLATLPVIIIAVPWYMLTSRLSAEGFMFEGGLAYATQALTFNLGVLADNVTILGMFLALAGAVLPMWKLPPDSPERQMATSMLSLLLATLLFQSLVPVALVGRYMAPALPALVMLVILGLHMLGVSRGITALNPGPRRVLAIFAGAVMLLPGVIHLATAKAQRDLRMDEAAAFILARGDSGIIVADGSGGASAEHDFMAAMLSAGRAARLNTKINIIRSSKFLSSSDRMGNKYQLAAETPQAVGEMLLDLGAGIVVTNRFEGDAPFKHSLLLQEYLASGNSAYYLAHTLEHGYRKGATFIYFSRQALTPNIAKAQNINKPPGF